MDEYSEYWREYWLSHRKLDNNDPQMQVARTKFGTPISNSDWLKTCEHIRSQLKPRATDYLLDLCCGNGLLTAYLIDYVDKINAVDYSQKLLDDFVVENDRVTRVFSDVLNYNYGSCSFNCVIMYYAAQHFSESNMLSVVKKVHSSMTNGGVFLIGDVPDANRKWDYFYKPEYRDFYFSGLESGQPAVGTWFEKKFFKYLSKYIGFESVEIMDQPDFMNNSNHRFDVLFIK